MAEDPTAVGSDPGAARGSGSAKPATATRRSVVGFGAALAGGAGAGLVGYGVGRGGAGAPDALAADGAVRARPAWAEQAEPFHGEHQSGILTAPQAHVTFLALDLPAPVQDGSQAGEVRDRLRRLMRLWSSSAARLQQGVPALADAQPDLAAPPSRLTVTVGLGRGALAAAGLLPQCPAWLQPLPAFTVDRLETRWSDGDVIAQVCAEDPIVLAHAVRTLILDAGGIAQVRWHQSGFRRPVTSTSTMRNLMGQVDGTVQPSDAEVGDLVWVGPEGPEWLRGGSALVLRRIRMNLDTWDSLDPIAKEQVIGRRLDSGAPLTGTKETDKADLDARIAGLHVIPDFAHIRHAAPVGPREKILRRPYNYDERPSDGQTADAGLLFAAYQRDPVAQFVPIQRRLDSSDLLNVWTTPVGSAVFAMLPGVGEGDYLGRALLEG